jgi:hypothetical protein
MQDYIIALQNDLLDLVESQGGDRIAYFNSMNRRTI